MVDNDPHKTFIPALYRSLYDVAVLIETNQNLQLLSDELNMDDFMDEIGCRFLERPLFDDEKQAVKDYLAEGYLKRLAEHPTTVHESFFATFDLSNKDADALFQAMQEHRMYLTFFKSKELTRNSCPPPPKDFSLPQTPEKV